VFNEVVRTALKDKAVLFVTNQLQFLPQMDGIVVLGKDADGVCEVQQTGTFDELTAAGVDLSHIVAETTSSDSDDDDDDDGVKDDANGNGDGAVVAPLSAEGTAATRQRSASSKKQSMSKKHSVSQPQQRKSTSKVVSKNGKETSESGSVVKKKPAQRLMVGEEKAVGRVQWNTYKHYLTRSGGWYVVQRHVTQFRVAP
jgi:hypothetical protein